MAGRPKGSRDKTPRRTAARKVAESYLGKGVTPLDVLLDNMRDAAGEVTRLRRAKADRSAILAERERAGFWADKAAPYLHPKRAAVDGDGNSAPTIQINISGDDSRL